MRLKRTSRSAAVLAAAATLSGCEALTGCKDDERVVEVEFGSVFSNAQRSILQGYRDNGYNCRDDGSIRNAFGRVIGTRYVCSKCD